MAENIVAPHIFGTPETCLQRVRQLRDKFRTDHFAAIFSDGGIPIEIAERSIRRFATEVLPELRRDESRDASPETVQMASK
jgi:alkanesulfonate monooxygenase SsuD/methylene tetrahydromethanopterin reductase-like flavin-dependent oxidoreductase (luciferase family)